MKRLLTIVLLVSFIIHLTSCGNKTDLTMDNYEDYLVVTTTTQGGGESFTAKIDDEDFFDGVVTHAKVYTNLIFNTNVKGASTNFNYKNVTVKIKVSGTYYDLYKYTGYFDSYYIGSNTPKVFTLEYDIPLNIAGDGNNGTVITDLSQYNSKDKHVTSDSLINVTYEVVSISGYVEAA